MINEYNHYPNLRKCLSKEEIGKYSHRPVQLSFGEEDDDGELYAKA